jgi:hypothetical protein
MTSPAESSSLGTAAPLSSSPSSSSSPLGAGTMAGGNDPPSDSKPRANSQTPMSPVSSATSPSSYKPKPFCAGFVADGYYSLKNDYVLENALNFHEFTRMVFVTVKLAKSTASITTGTGDHHGQQQQRGDPQRFLLFPVCSYLVSKLYFYYYYYYYYYY